MSKRKKADSLNDFSKRTLTACRYCGTQIEWRGKRPFIAFTNERHHCKNYIPPNRAVASATPTPIVTDLALVQQVKDLRDEVNTLRTQIASMTKGKPMPTNDHEKRIVRLEGIVVELRNDRTAAKNLQSNQTLLNIEP